MAETAPPAPVPAPRGDRGLRRAIAPLRVRNYAIFWTGGFLSNTGRWVQDIVVPYVLYDLTGDASVLGLAAFLRFAPSVLVGPVAGAVADRFHRRNVVLVTQAALSAVAVALWVAAATGSLHVPVLIGLSALTGVVHAMNGPVWQAFLSELVPRQHLSGAITLASAQMNVAKAAGPGLAGLILATLGPAAAFLITAVSYVAVLVTVACIDVPRRNRAVRTQRMLPAFVTTIRHVLARRGLAASIGAMSVAAALGMPILQLTPVFATDVFGVGPSGFGLLAGALGFGGVVAAPVLGGWTHAVPAGRLIAGSLLGYGLALVAFAQAPIYAVGVVAMVLVGAGFLFASATVISVLQLGVADEMRGSVAAVFSTAFSIAYPIGSLVQGWAAQHAGVRLTVTVAGIGVVAAAVTFASARGVQRSLRDIHAEGEEAEATVAIAQV